MNTSRTSALRSVDRLHDEELLALSRLYSRFSPSALCDQATDREVVARWAELMAALVVKRAQFGVGERMSQEQHVLEEAFRRGIL